MFIIFNKETNTIVANETCAMAAAEYNQDTYDYFCWNNCSGSPPKIGRVITYDEKEAEENEALFFDGRTKGDKRKAMYILESDPLFIEWQGQLLDGDIVKSLAAENAWRNKRNTIRTKYP